MTYKPPAGTRRPNRRPATSTPARYRGAPTPARPRCTCGARDLPSCLCGLTPAEWTAAHPDRPIR